MLEKLKDKITEYESSDIKSNYIRTFIDTDKPWYEKYIIDKWEYKDGKYYHGYLWDCIKDGYELISLQNLHDYRKILGTVNVFWDLHSEYHQVDRKRYWNFGRNSILSLEYEVLLDILDYLPEDIYVFDNNFEWTIIITHEDIEGKPMLFKIGNIKKLSS